VTVDDVKCFDLFGNLNNFVEGAQNDEDFKSVSVSDKWVKYFQKNCNADCHSELLKIAEFFFRIPGHNANVERIFSSMKAKWTDYKKKAGLTFKL
jgi:ferredoxin-fold anticodon binding domain-containing protein